MTATHRETRRMETTAHAVHARRLGLTTSRGPVYPAISLDIARGAVTALLGPARSGRTALLLTLAGRMRPSSGSARVCGHDVVRSGARVRKLVGLGLVAGVNDLDDALTAGQHLAERVLLSRGRRPVDSAYSLAFVGLAGAENTPVRDIDTAGRTRLGIALGLVGNPCVLAIDDIDHDLELAEQAAIISRLRDIAASGVAVLFTCVDERTAALADTVITLGVAAREEEVPSFAVS
jgi:ABC-2 type transport system ATP-binding protein